MIQEIYIEGGIPKISRGGFPGLLQQRGYCVYVAGWCSQVRRKNPCGGGSKNEGIGQKM